MNSATNERVYDIKEWRLSDDIHRIDMSPGLSSPSLLARTTTVTTYPATPFCYYACTPQWLTGTEQEGGNGVVVGGSNTFFALNLGTTVPPSGTLILVTFTGNRWVFRYDA